jgi:ribosomal protein L21E
MAKLGYILIEEKNLLISKFLTITRTYRIGSKVTLNVNPPNVSTGEPHPMHIFFRISS